VSRSDIERTADICDAARELADAVAVGHDEFVTTPLRVRAAERLLEIIGEASNQLSDEFRASHPDVPWSDVVALRVLLAHHYHRIDVEQVWTIATVSVPDLVRSIGAE
jgi:uncharacterized protein with HEPN domain